MTPRLSPALALALACTPSSPSPAPQPATPASPTASPTPDPATPTPTPDPATPTAPAPAPPDAPPELALPGAPAGSAFQLAAFRDGDLSVHVLGDRVFVLGTYDLAYLAPAGDRLVRPEYAFTGLADPQPSEYWRVHAFGGVWPDDAWLVTQHEMSRGSYPQQVHRREGERWRKLDNKVDLLYWYYAAIFPGKDGQHLGLRMYDTDPALYEDYTEQPTRTQRRARRMLEATRPGFDVLGAPPTPALPVIAGGLEPITAAAAPTGELFLLARRTVDDRERAVLQRWGTDGDAAIHGTVDALPYGGRCGQLVVRARDEVYLACTPWNDEKKSALLRFDGAAWTSEPSADGTEIQHFAVAPDGTQWMIVDSPVGYQDDFDKNELWRRAPGGAWEHVDLPELRFPDRALPEWIWPWEGGEYVLDPPDPAAAARSYPVSPRSVLARAGGDVWLTGQVAISREGLSGYPVSREVVLRNATLREPLRLLSHSDLALELRDWRPAPEWKPGTGCPEGQPAFATLHVLPRDAPKNAPDPLVEALVRDQRAAVDRAGMLAEVWHRGRRTVGLFVTLSEKSDAEQFIAALTRVAPDEPHPLECRRPRLRRTFDKATGKPLESPAL